LDAVVYGAVWVCNGLEWIGSGSKRANLLLLLVNKHKKHYYLIVERILAKAALAQLKAKLESSIKHHRTIIQ
jgi:hypothetical protein